MKLGLASDSATCSHEVATIPGAHKTIVLATRKRHSRSRAPHIVPVEVEPLSGDEPHGLDIVDRLKWQKACRAPGKLTPVREARRSTWRSWTATFMPG